MGEPEVAKARAEGCFWVHVECGMCHAGGRQGAIRARTIHLTPRCSGTAFQGWARGGDPSPN